ncbi:hypothetical protein Cgig2_017959 [Carnegiea gigantea]|uniref:Uncharacterized protein n=1 Tax=Carnegiea gigantea TaxID=171969 RepID=A0A9Q1K939_9CARY|nr:hypothetical protein Cgig2_017959 [Carnegiea gigantea]
MKYPWWNLVYVDLLPAMQNFRTVLGQPWASGHEDNNGDILTSTCFNIPDLSKCIHRGAQSLYRGQLLEFPLSPWSYLRECLTITSPYASDPDRTTSLLAYVQFTATEPGASRTKALELYQPIRCDGDCSVGHGEIRAFADVEIVVCLRVGGGRTMEWAVYLPLILP